MDSTVRRAGESEALEVLRSKGVRHRLGVEPDAIRCGTPYLVNGRMLLILIEQSGECEAHIASPRIHWNHIHADINEALKFIASIGYNRAYTTVDRPLKTTANLITKHGFKLIDQTDKEGVYLWESDWH